MTNNPKIKLDNFIHGCDYNPEQWLDFPEVLEEDIRLMKLAGINAVSIGIFSWVSYEPDEGQYTFQWMDSLVDRLYEAGISFVLATPSGARPAWLAKKYPEVLRTNPRGEKMKFGGRHNHCLTSPVYRRKTKEINERLARRYGNHPGLVLWHVSNEYSGACYCDHCQSAFRDFLKEKYGTLDKLNRQYWTAFWSHTYTSWDQIEAPSPLGESEVHGLNLDWKRFVSNQTIDFYKNEIEPLRKLTPDIPITTNFMDVFYGIDYRAFSKHVDVVSLDLYPEFRGRKEDTKVSAYAAFNYDLMRGLKQGQPFLLMECTPSTQNWQDIATLKRPGQHLLATMQAVACGSDSVQYFQWRKSRGSSEKFHGAVVDHVGHENTRVFREVAQVGETLKSIKDILGARKDSKVALIFDWENWWAFDNAQGYSNINKNYKETCFEHYYALWKMGINVDIIGWEADLDRYDLVIAPMLYMTKEKNSIKLEQYVLSGGTVVGTYISGIVNENDLVYRGGFPGPLRKLYGIWVEETDVKYEEDKNAFVYDGERYLCHTYFDIVHLETAVSKATYEQDFYAGQPAVTENTLGEGHAYYLATQAESQFLSKFYGQLEPIKKEVEKLGIEEFDEGISISSRACAGQVYRFILNTTSKNAKIKLNGTYTNLLENKLESGRIELPPFGYMILN